MTGCYRKLLCDGVTCAVSFKRKRNTGGEEELLDLFDYMRETKMESEAPLASRIRPRTLDEIVGQQHILAKDKLLYRAIKADKLSSVIFYGPPGTGKTTIAKVIAGTTSAAFTQIKLRWQVKKIWKKSLPRQNRGWACMERGRFCL